MSSRDQIEEIKRRLDIIAVAREYLPSLKRGGKNYFALCPFHNEKSPSFSINPDMGRYKCFGCGESGDVINLIEKIEGIDFVDALQLAAKKAGVVLDTSYVKSAGNNSKERERILAANLLTAEFFHYILFKHEIGAEARKYVTGRQLRKEELRKFKIGFAPKGYENLKSFLLKKGYTTKELVDWGLLVSKNGKIYDKFRNRLMFPIFNQVGDVIGFSGRIIDKNDLGPKYLNSPETLVYKKSQILYGLYQARDAARKQGFLILVEGNVDILMSHAQGIENISAPLGTALTQEQVKLIKRYCDTIYFAFDTDAAGEKALTRALELAEAEDMQVKAINIEGFQDVDDLIKNGGNWQDCVRNAQTIVDHMLIILRKRFDLNTALGKDRYAKAILALIKKLKSSIEQVHYLEKLSGIIKIDIELLRKELEKITLSGVENKQAETLSSRLAEVRLPTSHYKKLLAYLVQNPAELTTMSDSDRDFIKIETQEYKILKLIESGMEVNGIRDSLNSEAKEILDDLLLMPITGMTPTELRSLIQLVRKESIKEEIKALGFAEDSEENSQKLQNLTKKLAKLQA